MLTKNSIKRPYTVVVMLIVIAIVGGVAVTQMPLDLFPEMELPYVIVATMVPGASAEVVEKTVTQSVESNMRQINNVKDVQSISADSVSAVIMALQNGTDLTKMTVDIETSIKSIRGSFPDMAMDPIVMDVDPDMMPIMTLTISKYGQTIEQSSEALREISDKIRSVGGVASITTTGDIEDKVFMQVDPEKILKDPMNLVLNHVSAYLNNPRKTMPAELNAFLDNKDNTMIKAALDMVKASPNDALKMLKMMAPDLSLDLSGILGEDQKDMFLASFEQMLTPEMVSMMITGNDFEMPAGTKPVKGVDFVIKVGQKLARFDELKHLPAFSLDLREMKFAENGPTAIDMMKPLLGGVGDPATMSEADIKAAIEKIIGKAPKVDEDNYAAKKKAYDEQYAQYDEAIRAGGLIIPMKTTDTKIDDTIKRLVGTAPVLPDNATAEQTEAYNKAKEQYDKTFGMVKSFVGSVLYSSTDNVNYTRNEDMYNYILGILYQPMTVELQDFAYMYNTNTAASAHTIVNGADGMMLSIFKTPDASVTKVTNGILDLMKEIQAEDDTIECIVLSNQGEVTKFMITSIAQNLLLGALFAILVLLIFLRDWKPTITVGMSILVSLVTAFAVMYLCGVTLNLVSMGGLALSVGMLVDNSIVVIENIYRKRNEGVSAIKAAYEGTKQVAGAIMSSTITTVIVFLPIIFVDGITKQIFTDLAITIAVSLFASLLVAITFVPMISSRMVNLNKAARHETKAFVKFKAAYSKALNFMLDKKWITVSVVTLLFVASIVSAFFMNVEFMPSTQMEQIIVSVGIDKSKLTDEYSYDEIVDDVIKDINREFRNKDYVDNLGVELSGGMTVMGFTMGGGNIMSYVTLDKKAKIKPEQAINELEEIVEQISKDPKYPQDAVVSDLEKLNNSGGIDIQKMVNSYLDASLLAVNVYGTDIDEMREAALQLKEQFANNIVGKNGEADNTLDVDDGLLQVSKEFRLKVDTHTASKYNLTTAQIFLQYFSKTMPETANSSINFTTDGENEIYVYTAANNMDRWYRTYETNDDGSINYDKPHRMYFNKGDDTNTAVKFEERTKNSVGNIEKTIFKKTKDNEITRFTSLDGSKTYAVPSNDMPVYTDNSKLLEADMITLGIDVPKFGEMPDMSDNSMMPMAAEQNGDALQKKTVPIFMLLDKSSFALKTVGQIDYRMADDYAYDATMYYEDANGYLRYNYTGEDIAALQAKPSREPQYIDKPDKEHPPIVGEDVNPFVPVGIREIYGFNTINHVEGKRVVQMSLKSDVLSNKQLEKQARAIINDFNKANAGKNITVEFVGANEVISDTFNGLFLMIAMAVVFIYLVMVAQFQSLKSPFIIMFTIPLALTGSILTLLMAGMPISVFALTGIILLVGIVVNNGIVFVDYVNKLREAGMPKREALIKTAQDRIRPILMTALTTICSMLISVFDTSMGASAIKPMAVTVVGGLTYATLLTLFFVPILYDAFNRKEKLAVIKFDDDKEEDIEAEMRMNKISSVKEVLVESQTLAMMDEGYIANNIPTETPMETYINETTGDAVLKEEEPKPTEETKAEEAKEEITAEAEEDPKKDETSVDEETPAEDAPAEETEKLSAEDNTTSEESDTDKE